MNKKSEKYKVEKKTFFILDWYTFHIFQIFISKIFKVELLIIPQNSCFEKEKK